MFSFALDVTRFLHYLIVVAFMIWSLGSNIVVLVIDALILNIFINLNTIFHMCCFVLECQYPHQCHFSFYCIFSKCSHHLQYHSLSYLFLDFLLFRFNVAVFFIVALISNVIINFNTIFTRVVLFQNVGITFNIYCYLLFGSQVFCFNNFFFPLSKARQLTIKPP